MARYEVTTETDRSRVSRTTGKLPTEVRVKHHARSMEHAVGDLLRITVQSDGYWSLWARSADSRGEKMIASGQLPTN